MVMGRVTALLLIAYVVLSAFVEKSEGGGSIMPADIYLSAVGALFFLGYLLKGRLIKLDIYFKIYPLILVFLLGGLFSKLPDKALSELVIILFVVCGSYLMASMLVGLHEETLRWFFSLYLTSLGFLAFICVLDFTLIPGLIASRNLGGLQGPFSNTGQAGSFFGVHVSIAVALLVSGLVSRKLWNWAMLFFLLLALVFTLKRAATIGFFIGFALLVLQLYFSKSLLDKKLAVRITTYGSVIGMFVFLLFVWGLENIPGMDWRFGSKFSYAVVQEAVDQGFIVQNVINSIRAFIDSPLYGVGLANVAGVYQSHEIHSTYFSMLAYGGILGVLFYAYFMFFVLRLMFVEFRLKAQNEFSRFLRYLFPMFIGLLVSWAYTTHWRKREFWILIAFIVVCSFMSKKAKYTCGERA